ncbi:hypothetical protein NDU88_006437 [Pleurodeles waltl]|uniref:Uncharacterized protein n=1 Tax=Pleurodeles waltl TaxID=8319 RepID=A0AAV7LUW6_PLEWA|nr:hypothetical protein NDU88_006437 [Pleurodeles waltl]
MWDRSGEDISKSNVVLLLSDLVKSVTEGSLGCSKSLEPSISGAFGTKWVFSIDDIFDIEVFGANGCFNAVAEVSFRAGSGFTFEARVDEHVGYEEGRCLCGSFALCAEKGAVSAVKASVGAYNDPKAVVDQQAVSESLDLMHHRDWGSVLPVVWP